MSFSYIFYFRSTDEMSYRCRYHVRHDIYIVFLRPTYTACARMQRYYCLILFISFLFLVHIDKEKRSRKVVQILKFKNFHILQVQVSCGKVLTCWKGDSRLGFETQTWKDRATFFSTRAHVTYILLSQLYLPVLSKKTFTLSAKLFKQCLHTAKTKLRSYQMYLSEI